MKIYPIEHEYTKNVFAIATGEYRPPKKGEFFLSGATPIAYKSFSDLSTPFYIARKVLIEKQEITTIMKYL